MASVSLTRVIEKMKLENLTPEIDVKHVKITQPDINRPALQLAGYFEHFDATRLQIVGFVEYTYMEGMTDETRKEDQERDSAKYAYIVAGFIITTHIYNGSKKYKQQCPYTCLQPLIQLSSGNFATDDHQQV